MNSDSKPFYAKILLFGEYSLMHGSGALTIPFRERYVRLLFPSSSLAGGALRSAGNSNRQLRAYCAFLREKDKLSRIGIDIDSFETDIENRIFLQSNIPSGYGLGSSGALVAAVYDRYAYPSEQQGTNTASTSLQQLKDKLALMESFFHGTSSGLDPLNSYLQQAIVIGTDKTPVTIQLQLNRSEEGGFFLLDTGQSRNTQPLVSLFKEKMKQPAFRNMLEQQYIPLNDAAIKAVVSESKSAEEMLYGLSDLQLRHFREMIPESFQRVWAEGLSSGKYSFKLCGAGGGGFILGYTGQYATAFSSLSSLKKDIVPLHINKI